MSDLSDVQFLFEQVVGDLEFRVEEVVGFYDHSQGLICERLTPADDDPNREFLEGFCQALSKLSSVWNYHGELALHLQELRRFNEQHKKKVPE